MKNLINRKMAGRLAVTALVISVSASLPARGAVKVEAWRFDSGASPAHPELVTVAPASCSITVTQGNFASGWVADNQIFGSANGVWDLGRSGTMACRGLTGLIGGPGQERVVTVKVKQYRDGGIYYDPTAVSVPGATVLSSNVTSAAGGTLGNWVIQETRWKVAAESTVDALQITGAYDGSLVDEISVEAAAIGLPPPQLAIRRTGVGNNQIEVSWPSGYSNMILEANDGANDAQGWSPVSAAVQTSGEVSSVTVEATGTARFYRLKQN